uniref:Major royal jelly protein 1 n=1 Tax=Bactrocera dorsalis TaxID=27457 RepID=A0A034WE30_BACDO
MSQRQTKSAYVHPTIIIWLIGVMIATLHTSLAWHLAQTGLTESYRVRHLSLYYSRVFLCISVESELFPTLIATKWPENFVPLQSAIYPHRFAHANGNRSDCELIQKAIWTQVDNLGRLWVFDAGWEPTPSTSDKKVEKTTKMCSPKLLVYDLIRNDAEVLRIDCSRYLTPRDSEKLIIKLGPSPALCKVEKYIYFLRPDDAHILAYDIVEQKWHRRALLSRKFQGIIEAPFPIKPIDIAFAQQRELLFADADGKLYATPNSQLKAKTKEVNEIANDLNAKKLQQTEVTKDDVSNSIELELLGSLLGPSKGMMVDERTGALYYAVPKYGAIVRCALQRNLTAEDNEIVYFTSKNIQQIFFGVGGAVWLLTDRLLEPDDHCFSNI